MAEDRECRIINLEDDPDGYLVKLEFYAPDKTMIVLKPRTTLSQWRKGPNTTKIQGGHISARTINIRQFTIEYRSIDDAIHWCEENCRYGFKHIKYSIFFMGEEDAMMCFMRFG